jgi:hypothetical protein
MDVSHTQDILSQIHAEKLAAKATVRAPADDAAIARLISYAADERKTALPEGYIAFLKRNDGLDFNGNVIYGATTQDSPYLSSFQQANELFSDADPDYVLYGENGDELFAQHRATGAWQIIDRPSLSLLEQFDSFDALLDKVLRDAYEY